MKKLIIYGLLIASFPACQSSDNKEKGGLDSGDIVIEGSDQKVDPDNLPDMVFEEMVYDFGKITQGEKVVHAFQFSNNGKKDLIISSASASCGCTVAQPPKEPIPAGGSGKIDVTFNSEGKSGVVNKNITVLTNCVPNTKILTIKAEIIVPNTTEPNQTIKK